MKWLTFTILAAIMLTLQLSISSFIALGPQQVVPDFLILAAILIAFRAGSDDDALLQCWLLGLVHDLTSITPFGIYSVSLALAGVFIIVMRKWLYVQNVFMIVFWTLLFTVIVEHAAVVVLLLRGQMEVTNFAGVSRTIWFSGAYTAAMAPYLQVFIKQPKWTFNN